MTQPDFIEQQLDRIEAKLDTLLTRGGGGSAPTPTGPDPSPTPSAGYPADVFGTNWKLTLPVNGAQEIKQPALATYMSKYCELNAAGEVVFRAWHGGDTTSGSKNPRSELREMDGSNLAGWSATKGRHRMVVAGRVTRLTKVKPEVVVAQIHDADDDVTVFRLEGSKLWITAGDTTHGFLVDGNVALGQDYEVGFDVSGGVVSYLYNGGPVPYTLKSKFSGGYFKTGDYLQSNTSTAPSESTSEYSEVVLRSVAVIHS